MTGYSIHQLSVVDVKKTENTANKPHVSEGSIRSRQPYLEYLLFRQAACIIVLFNERNKM